VRARRRLAAAVLVCLAARLPASTDPVDPFAFFQPSLIVSAEERRQLDHGEPIARMLPTERHEIAVFAAVRVSADADRLVAWMRHVDQLKKSAYVLAIRRFSVPPRLDDLADLTLDDDDRAEARKCRPGDCGLKLSAEEMAALQRAGGAPDWQLAVDQAFRAVILERVKAYLADGHGAVPAYADHAAPLRPAERFVSVLDHSLFLTARLPRFAASLRNYPRDTPPALESFMYWSKERLAGRAVVSATHVNILRGSSPGDPEVIVAGKQIFTTHYVNTALGLTVLVRGQSTPEHFLVYINRSDVELPGGMLAGMVRWFAERRVRSEAAEVLDGLRRRIDQGEPAADSK
jgi:hypothetical protein